MTRDCRSIVRTLEDCAGCSRGANQYSAYVKFLAYEERLV